MRLLKGPIAQATLRTSAMLGLRLFAQAGTLLLLTRELGPANFGRFSAIAALALLLGLLATAGTHLTLLRDLSQNANLRTQLLPGVLGTTLVCGSILLLLYVPISLTLLQADIALPVVLCIGIAELLLQPFLAIRSSEYQAQGKIARSQFLVITPLLLRLSAIGALYFLKKGNTLLLYASCYLLAVAAALLVASRWSNEPWPPMTQWRLLRATQLHDNGSYALMNVAALGPTEIDKPIAVKLMSAGDAGTYAAAARVMGALVLPIMALMLSALPRLFREAGSRDSMLLKLIFSAALTYGLCSGVCLWLLTTPLEFLFGRNYEGIVSNLHWLALAMPGMCLRFAAVSSLMAEDKPWLRIIIELLGCACIFGFSFGLAHFSVPHFMPITIVCSEWLMAICAWCSLLIERIHPINSAH